MLLCARPACRLRRLGRSGLRTAGIWGERAAVVSWPRNVSRRGRARIMAGWSVAGAQAIRAVADLAKRSSRPARRRRIGRIEDFNGDEAERGQPVPCFTQFFDGPKAGERCSGGGGLSAPGDGTAEPAGHHTGDGGAGSCRRKSCQRPALSPQGARLVVAARAARGDPVRGGLRVAAIAAALGGIGPEEELAAHGIAPAAWGPARRGPEPAGSPRPCHLLSLAAAGCRWVLGLPG